MIFFSYCDTLKDLIIILSSFEYTSVSDEHPQGPKGSMDH